MRCITWNMHGLRDEKRHEIEGRYLQEWEATEVCLQEKMWEQCEAQDRNEVS